MLDKIKQVPTTVKNYVVEHKTAVAVVATAALGVVMNRAAMSSHNEFLKEHDLYEEYYNPEIESV